MIFATGLTRLRPDQARRHARLAATPIRQRLGSAPTMPPDLSAFLPDVMDQGQTGSCVAHAGAAGAFAACAAALALGLPNAAPLPFVPSPDDIYRLLRCRERMSKYDPLDDSGANIADVLDIITRFGVRPIQPMPGDRYSDVYVETVNREPTLDDLTRDATAMLLDVDSHPLASDPAEFDDALSHGAIVLIAVPGGSDEFQNFSGGILQAIPSKPQLDHCVLLYRKRDGQNSWGKVWGDAGRFSLSDGFIATNTGDAFALSIRKAA